MAKVSDLLLEIGEREFVDGFDIEKYLKPRPVKDFNKVYKVPVDEYYYLINAEGEIDIALNMSDELDCAWISRGVVLTKSEAEAWKEASDNLQKAREKMRELNGDWVPDWHNNKIGKYHLDITHYANEVRVGRLYYTSRGMMNLYFGHRAHAEQVANMFTYEKWCLMAKVEG